MKFALAVRNIDGRIRAQAGLSLLVRVVDYVSIDCSFLPGTLLVICGFNMTLGLAWQAPNS